MLEGLGLGRQLAESSIEFAWLRGDATMRLDTLAERMPAAVSMYRRLGFREIAAYVDNPEHDALFMELRL